MIAFLLLGLILRGLDGDDIGQELGGAHDAGRIVGAHDADLDADATSAEEDVALSGVNEFFAGGTGADHVSVTELHGLATLSTDLAGDDDVNTLGAGLHAEAQDAHRGTADGEGANELEAEGLDLGHGGEATVLDALDVDLDATFGVLEALLDDGGQLADTAALLTKDFLSLGGVDHDLGTGGGDTVVNTAEAILSELALEELVELGVEDTVADELSLLAEGSHDYLCPLSRWRKKNKNRRDKKRLITWR